MFDEERDVALAVVPFYHMLGMGVYMGITFYQGVKTIVHERFEIEKFFDSLQRHKVCIELSVSLPFNFLCVFLALVRIVSNIEPVSF